MLSPLRGLTSAWVLSERAIRIEDTRAASLALNLARQAHADPTAVDHEIQSLERVIQNARPHSTFTELLAVLVQAQASRVTRDARHDRLRRQPHTTIMDAELAPILDMFDGRGPNTPVAALLRAAGLDSAGIDSRWDQGRNCSGPSCVFDQTGLGEVITKVLETWNRDREYLTPAEKLAELRGLAAPQRAEVRTGKATNEESEIHRHPSDDHSKAHAAVTRLLAAPRSNPVEPSRALHIDSLACQLNASSAAIDAELKRPAGDKYQKLALRTRP